MLIAQELDCAGERIASLAMVSAFERLILAHNKPVPGLWDSAAELPNRRGGPDYLSGRDPALVYAAVSTILRSGMVRGHFARKICKKQALWAVEVGLYQVSKDRYSMKLIFVVKEIAVFIERSVINIRRDDGIERQIVQTIVGFALVIIFFESIHNIGIIIPHNQLLSKSQTKAELFRANTADYDMKKAKLLFPAHNTYIRHSKNLVRRLRAEVRKIFALLKEKNYLPDIERIGEI